MNNQSWVFLFVAFFIGGLFLGNVLTGQVVRENTIETLPVIRLEPFRVSNGDVMIVNVDARDSGASAWFTLRDDNGNRRDKVFYCRGYDDLGNKVISTGSDDRSLCYSLVSIEYEIPFALKKGIYYIELDNAKAYFEIV